MDISSPVATPVGFSCIPSTVVGTTDSFRRTCHRLASTWMKTRSKRSLVTIPQAVIWWRYNRQ